MTAPQSTVQAEDLSAPSLVEAVRPHLDAIRSRARDAERAREPLREIRELVCSLGIVRALVPRAHGGLEHDVFDWLQSLRVLSRADMSAGWFAGLASAHAFGLTKFDPRLQREIWGRLGPDALISSATALAEDGIAAPVEGGFRLTGRWRFSSGITAADWAMVLMKATDPATGQLADYWAFLPQSDFTVVDTWRVAGMRGTGSHDITVSGAFIPQHRVGGPGLWLEPVGGNHYENPLFAVPFEVIYPIIFAPVALGGAEAAVELHTEQLKKRKAAITGIPVIESPLAQVRLAEATMAIRAIAAILERRWRDVADHVHTARASDPETQMWWRVTDSFVGREAVRIVERIVESAGASIYFEANPLQQFWRDIHATGGHTYFNNDSAMQILGRHLLGLAPDPTLI